MRSEYVFAAVKEIENRFMLCRVASASARRLHIDSTRSSDTINKSLNLIAAGNTTTKAASPDAQAAIAQPVAASE
ncbi:MAG TPA: hypothetical protein VKW06_09975 [Candidatus Angelobacter sp.]|nr:hypothetical protein [Candidatus Angelobacter sp.]